MKKRKRQKPKPKPESKPSPKQKAPDTKPDIWTNDEAKLELVFYTGEQWRSWVSAGKPVKLPSKRGESTPNQRNYA